MNMARMRVRPAGNTMEERVVWIYEIQPSSNFYSVPNSVQHTVDRITACVDTSLETRTRANRLYDVVRISRDEHEWVAHGGIEPAQIVRASQYHLNDAGMLEEIPGSRLNNENFVANPSAVANSEHGRTSPPIFWQG